MAELGDFIDQGPTSRKEVTVEMMDYKVWSNVLPPPSFMDPLGKSPFPLDAYFPPQYVDECNDPTELRAILTKLKSGEEGSFPHLQTHTEERLLSLLPDKEQRKIKALKVRPIAHFSRTSAPTRRQKLPSLRPPLWCVSAGADGARGERSAAGARRVGRGRGGRGPGLE